MMDGTENTASAPSALTPAERAEFRGIEDSMRDNKSSYWSDPEAQQRWRELDTRARGAVPAPAATPNGPLEPVEREGARSDAAADAEFAKSLGVTTEALAVGRDALGAISSSPAFAADMEISAITESLPDTLRSEMMRELSSSYVRQPSHASGTDLQKFEATPHGRLLGKQWGENTARRLGVALARVARFEESLDDGDMRAWQFFWRNSLSPEQRAVLLDQISA